MLKCEKLLWSVGSMAENKKKLYMEMQMEELKATLADGDEDDLDPLEEMMKEQAASKKKVNKNSEKERELAKMYVDAYDYEEELEAFEKELEVVKKNNLKDIAAALLEEFPDVKKDYHNDFKASLIGTWKHNVEVKQSHPQEQLDLIEETEFTDIVQKFNATYPNYEGNFEAEVKLVLVKRWEMLISIKQEHIDEELEEIYIAGLKPSYVKRIYKQVHGIK